MTEDSSWAGEGFRRLGPDVDDVLPGYDVEGKTWRVEPRSDELNPDNMLPIRIPGKRLEYITQRQFDGNPTLEVPFEKDFQFEMPFNVRDLRTPDEDSALD